MTIPKEIIKILETEAGGFEHGEVTLTIHRRGFKTRYTVGRKRSFIEEEVLGVLNTGPLTSVNKRRMKNERSKN
jgi:hypothetical protein